VPDMVGLDKHRQTSLWGIADKLITEASATEEPGAVIPHAGICAGAVG
jgi:hypothetical protein